MDYCSETEIDKIGNYTAERLPKRLPKLPGTTLIMGKISDITLSVCKSSC